MKYLILSGDLFLFCLIISICNNTIYICHRNTFESVKIDTVKWNLFKNLCNYLNVEYIVYIKTVYYFTRPKYLENSKSDYLIQRISGKYIDRSIETAFCLFTIV